MDGGSRGTHNLDAHGAPLIYCSTKNMNIGVRKGSFISYIDIEVIILSG